MKKEINSRKIFWVILALLFVIGIFFEKNIADFLKTYRNPYIYSFMNFLSLYEFLIPLLVLVYILSTFYKKNNIVKYPLSILITITFVYLLKTIISKQRPLSDELNSFPSNHSAVVFSVLPFINKKYRIIWLTFSSLVAFSRLYLGRHFLTDVIAGIVLGLVIGFYTDKIIEKKLK
jgi:undecaprenyl-diphosphatase